MINVSIWTVFQLVMKTTAVRTETKCLFPDCYTNWPFVGIQVNHNHFLCFLFAIFSSQNLIPCELVCACACMLAQSDCDGTHSTWCFL